jgi:hypothetical protein
MPDDSRPTWSCSSRRLAIREDRATAVQRGGAPAVGGQGVAPRQLSVSWVLRTPLSRGGGHEPDPVDPTAAAISPAGRRQLHPARLLPRGPAALSMCASTRSWRRRRPVDEPRTGRQTRAPGGLASPLRRGPRGSLHPACIPRHHTIATYAIPPEYLHAVVDGVGMTWSRSDCDIQRAIPLLLPLHPRSVWRASTSGASRDRAKEYAEAAGIAFR